MSSRKRHIAKTLTWRVLATSTTFLLTLFFFRDDSSASEKASWLALFDAILKIIFYYYHERVWFLAKLKLKSATRHLIKSITWRLIASVITFCLAYFFFKEDPGAIQKASGVVIAETFIKMAIYYVHERVWYASKYGL